MSVDPLEIRCRWRRLEHEGARDAKAGTMSIYRCTETLLRVRRNPHHRARVSFSKNDYKKKTSLKAFFLITQQIKIFTAVTPHTHTKQ